jgi:hypothetical protein
VGALLGRSLLEGGADPTIANNHGITPMAVAESDLTEQEKFVISAKRRRECVAALEVRFYLSPLCLSTTNSDQLAEAWAVCCLGHVGRRQSGPTCSGRPGRWPTSRGAEEGGQEGEAKEALVDWVVHGLKGDLFPDLMEYMG